MKVNTWDLGHCMVRYTAVIVCLAFFFYHKNELTKTPHLVADVVDKEGPLLYINVIKHCAYLRCIFLPYPLPHLQL